jgi:DNA-binding CsgD family transcriptional regulator
LAVLADEPLLERDEELEKLNLLLDAAAGGDGRLAVIEGPAGIGKTRLLAAVRETAAERGMQVFRARGSDLEGEFSYGVVRQLFERPLARAGPERASLLGGVASHTAPIFSAEGAARGGAHPNPPPSSAVLAHGLFWLVANLAERGPLLLAVDDAQWADAPSLRFLDYLGGRLHELPVAVALAVKPVGSESAVELLGRIAAEPGADAVRLGPLSGPAASELLRSLLSEDADDSLCDACFAATGGNPLLLRELAHALKQEGVSAGGTEARGVERLVPEAVARHVLVRLARLPPAASALARSAAVLGGGAELHDAATLADLPAATAAEALDGLVSADILASGRPLEFVHPLLREVVYAELAPGQRALWHARAARLLAEGGAPSERVAAQLLRAEPEGDAWVVARLRAAAADAMSHADPGAAISYLRRAFGEPVPRDERTALLEELIRAAFLAGDPTAADGLGFDPLAELEVDPQALAHSGHYLAMIRWSTGRTPEALAVLDRAMSTAMAGGDHDRALRIEVRRIALAQLPPTQARRRLEVLDGQVASGGFAGRVVDASLAWYGSLTGWSASRTLERGRRAFADQRLIGELQRDDELVLTSLVLALLRTDDLGLCERVIERILAHGRARGAASAVAGGSYLNGYLAHLRGDLMHAEADARAAVTAYQAIGVIARLPPLTALLIDALVDRGQLAEAAQELSAAGMDGEIPDHWWFGPVLWSRGYLRLAEGRTREGIDDVLQFGMRYQRDGMVPTVTRPWASHAAPLLAQLDEPEAARRLAERELKEARAWGTARTIGQAQRGLGLVIRGPEGIELLRESVRTLEASPARLEQARAQIDLGAALRRVNQRSAAREPLRRGLDLSHRCGARLLAERAAHELRATGAKPRKLVVTGVDSLTATELRIATMAADGLSNREIAQTMYLSLKTVEMHLSRTYRKLSIASRRELPRALAPADRQRSS